MISSSRASFDFRIIKFFLPLIFFLKKCIFVYFFCLQVKNTLRPSSTITSSKALLMSFYRKHSSLMKYLFSSSYDDVVLCEFRSRVCFNEPTRNISIPKHMYSSFILLSTLSFHSSFLFLCAPLLPSSSPCGFQLSLIHSLISLSRSSLGPAPYGRVLRWQWAHYQSPHCSQVPHTHIHTVTNQHSGG